MTGVRPIVLVVVSDPRLRRQVGLIVEELDSVPILLPTWKVGYSRLLTRAEAVVVDVDDLGDEQTVPLAPRSVEPNRTRLIVLSRRANVEEIAPRLGAVAGLRKPLDVGLMMAALGGVVQR